MKVLFVGPYRDNTGYAHTHINMARAMRAANIDVVLRPTKLNNYQPKLPEDILELESKSSSNCNVVIQHILPSMMEYNGRFEQNIAMFPWETSSIKRSVWPIHLEFMDKAITFCTHSYAAIQKYCSTYKCPQAIDTDIFLQNYDRPNGLPETDSFKFYFIGEMRQRKNISALIKAFHTTFEPWENVDLVIKTYLPGTHPEVGREKVLHLCKEVKANLNIYSNIDYYKKEIVLTQDYTDSEISALHYNCDCFVCPSFGEGWSIPTLEAMGFGKTPIVGNLGGMTEFIDRNTGYVCEAQRTPVYGMNASSIDGLYTGHEEWNEINISEMGQYMRYAFNNDKIHEVKRLNGINRVLNYSYSKVGKQLLDIINAQP